MKTVVILYMPGHAGNFIQRLFGLSPEFMPIIPRKMLKDLVDNWRSGPETWPKLQSYLFDKVFKRYHTWQNFHRDTADFLDYQDYRLLNYINHYKYRFIWSIHPWEFQTKFVELDQTQYYYVDLHSKFDSWVAQEQERLKFVTRPNEQEIFSKCVKNYNMQPISLTNMLQESHEGFLVEYQKICECMQVTAVQDHAIALWNNWLDTRFRIYH